jgi:hypothetical protein
VFGICILSTILSRYAHAHAHAVIHIHSNSIVGSGIWDCWRYEDFAAYVNEQLQRKRLPLSQAGDIILDESITRAIHNFGAKHYDDAALVMWQCS